MKTILVTGASGFIGKNLCAHLQLQDDVTVLEFTREKSQEELVDYVKRADFIYHIAGVNRPKDDSEFEAVNYGLTEKIVELLDTHKVKTPILLTSSIQAELDNPYGRSKVAAENKLLEWSRRSECPVYIYRLPGVFGKWSRPNYNSVVATFCHNIANDLPVEVSDPDRKITLVYIDSVISEFIKKFKTDEQGRSDFYTVPETFEVTLDDLKNRIESLHSIRSSLIVPNLEDKLNKYLYATYISYLKTDDFSYKLASNTDDRGSLTEFIKSNSFGQIFVSTTKPGISRGNHWHHTKIEKFFVIQGEAEITFRNKIDSDDVIRYQVSGDNPTVLDIPTGYVHAITNTGDTDLLTIFWANELLDKDNPDTYFEKIELESK